MLSPPLHVTSSPRTLQPQAHRIDARRTSTRAAALCAGVRALLGVALVVTLAAPTAVHAKKKSGPVLSVVVLPFVGMRGKAGEQARDALELELELVDTVRVESSEGIAGELDVADDASFARNALAPMLKKRRIDVLIRGVKSGASVDVTAYAQDGQARMRKSIASSEPEGIATSAADALRPAFAKWRTLKPLAAAHADASDDEDDDVVAPPKTDKKTSKKDKRSGDADLFVDEGDDDAPARRDPRAREPDRSAAQDDDAGTRRDGSVRRHGALDIGADDPADARRRAGSDAGSSRGDDDGPRRISDLDEPAPPAAEVRPWHTGALEAAFDGGSWAYTFKGIGGAGDNAFNNLFYPGGSVHASVWPVEAFGLEAEAAVAGASFKFDKNTGQALSPDALTSLQIRAAVVARGRWFLHFDPTSAVPAFGLGLRMGYRHWSGSSTPQVIAATQQSLTVVPGFTLHALSIGPEFTLPVVVAGRRVELELQTEALPATFYTEAPDNPGASTLAIGGHGALVVRTELVAGFTAHLCGRISVLSIDYKGAGNRNGVLVDAEGVAAPEVVALQGGAVRNLTGGFSVGVGYAW